MNIHNPCVPLVSHLLAVYKVRTGPLKLCLEFLNSPSVSNWRLLVCVIVSVLLCLSGLWLYLFIIVLIPPIVVLVPLGLLIIPFALKGLCLDNINEADFPLCPFPHKY